MKLKTFFSFAQLIMFSAITVSPIYAYDENEHFLAAACQQYASSSKSNYSSLSGKVVRTTEGVAVEHQNSKANSFDMVLYCNIDNEVDHFYNLFQIVAEDNAPAGYIKATLYREGLDSSNFGPPVALATVKTTDKPGVQSASVYLDVLELNEIFYHYYIEIVLHWDQDNTSDKLRIYSASIRNVL